MLNKVFFTMRLTIIFTLFLWLGPPLNVFAADKGPQKAFFAYGQVKEAVYAIHTEMSISKNAKRDRVLDNWKKNPLVIYSFTFRESKTRFKVGDSRIEVPLKGDLYDLKTLNISSSNSVDFRRGRTLVFTHGGVLPVGMKAFKAGDTFAIFPSASETLFFPVFKETGMTLRRGQKWKFTAMPCIVTPSVGLKIFQNKLKVQDLPPTIIHSHWRGWEKMNGYECAVIDFFFNVKSKDEFKEGKEEGEYSLKGTSYFSHDLGLPIVTTLDAKSFSTDKNGKKKSYNFHRREVLVSVQPMDGKKQTIKKDKPPTD
ncbi:hypothetical protein MNBD_PLANCTO02-188, partial [hydrothermal vent metagenome]